MMLKTERLMLRPFREGVSIINNADGNLIYENTYQYAILKKAWL